MPPSRETFARKKARILSQLAVPDADYADASPKGSVDAGIRQLIGEINGCAGLVTTSSCAGRASVYLEGRKTNKAKSAGAVLASARPGGEAAADGCGDGVAAAVMEEDDDDGLERAPAGSGSSAGGGKGGGQWLFVSHDPLVFAGDGSDDGEIYAALLGLGSGDEAAASATARLLSLERVVEDKGDVGAASRLIHFKFEPMILHVLTASHEHAQLVIQAGMEAGFRETGAVSLLGRGQRSQQQQQPEDEASPMVAVRCMGLSFESLIGAEETDGQRYCLVSPVYLRLLARIANERFVENEKRIARFQAALRAAFAAPLSKEAGGEWEDAEVRRERKREEGLRRRDQLKKQQQEEGEKEMASNIPVLGVILHQPDLL